MVKIIRRERRSAVLSPSTIACLSRIPTINLTAGCAHGCLYCYTRGYRSYPGDRQIVLYSNTLEKLQAELERKRKKPKAVYFSPASDVFQPVPEVLDTGYSVMDYLLSNGVGVAILTKGAIPPPHMARLIKDAPHVRVQVGLLTTNPHLSRLLEPKAAEPARRLAQLRQLGSEGIRTQARLDPIIPNVTDSPEALKRLLSAAAATGVKEVAASTLFMRPAVRRAISQRLSDEDVKARLFRAYDSSEKLAIHADNSTVWALPCSTRQQIYDRVTAIAKPLGLCVKVCACKNPDLPSQACSIAGDSSATRGPDVQGRLFADDKGE